MGLPAADSVPQEGREVCVCARVHMCVGDYADVIALVLSPSRPFFAVRCDEKKAGAAINL